MSISQNSARSHLVVTLDSIGSGVERCSQLLVVGKRLWDVMVEPIQLGRGAAFAAGAGNGGVQRLLRKMSRHPEDPRVFSQARIWIPLGLSLSLIVTLVMLTLISEYRSGENDDIYAIIVPGVFTLMCYTLLLHGLFRRFGVDRDKVWTRFGKVFYREVRFEDIDGFDVGVQRYKLYAGKTKVNIDYNRFDYSLVYIRVLEELQYRRFRLQKVEVDDAAWEETAQAHRNMFASKVYRSHRIAPRSGKTAGNYNAVAPEPPRFPNTGPTTLSTVLCPHQCAV